jgi:hypothetical protein
MTMHDVECVIDVQRDRTRRPRITGTVGVDQAYSLAQGWEHSPNATRLAASKDRCHCLATVRRPA